mgnify:CR=1 FL=1
MKNIYFRHNTSIWKLENGGWEVEGSFDIYKTLSDAMNYVDKHYSCERNLKRHEQIDNIKIIGKIDYSNYTETNKKAEYIYFNK